MTSLRLVFVAAVLILASSITTTTHAAQVGVDMVDIAWQTWGLSPFGAAGGTTAAIKHLHAACSTANLTLVRFAATPFWPVDFKKTLLNPSFEAEYWSRLEQLVESASRYGCRLIPSLFWQWWTPGDLHGEPLGEVLRNESCRTRSWMVGYVQKFVATLRPHIGKTIFALELGNELNLIADLNQSGKAGHPSLGQPAFRTAADNFSTSDMIQFEEWLDAVIHKFAPGIPVSTGHSVPRVDAEHLCRSYHAPQRDWTVDTKEEFSKNLRDTTQCCDLASIHFYADPSNFRWGTPTNSTEVLAVAAQTLAQTGKTMYVGEFGDKQPGPRQWTRDVLKRLGEIQDSEILPPSRILSSVWIWEFFQFSTTEPAPFSILPGRDHSIIEAMQKFNNEHDF